MFIRSSSIFKKLMARPSLVDVSNCVDFTKTNTGLTCEHVVGKNDDVPYLLSVLRIEWASDLNGNGGGSYASAAFMKNAFDIEELVSETNHDDFAEPSKESFRGFHRELEDVRTHGVQLVTFSNETKPGIQLPLHSLLPKVQSSRRTSGHAVTWRPSPVSNPVKFHSRILSASSKGHVFASKDVLFYSCALKEHCH